MGKKLESSKIHSRRITADQRYVVSEWTYQVSERIYQKREQSRLVFQFAVICLDKSLLCYEEKFTIFPLEDSTFQLFGLVSVYMASVHLYSQQRLEFVPNIQDMLSFCGGKFDLKQFLKCEKQLQLLNPFEIVSCVDYFSEIVKLGLKEESSIESLALVLMDSYILDHSTRKRPSAFITCAAIAVSRRLVYKETQPIWTPSHEQITSINFHSLKQCFDEMLYVAYLLFNEDEETEENCTIQTNFSQQPILI